jgi:flagellin-specific chaperone FliS
MSGAEQYQKNAHKVASNEQLVLLIFEKAITMMWSARDRLKEGKKIGSSRRFTFGSSLVYGASSVLR